MKTLNSSLKKAKQSKALFTHYFNLVTVLILLIGSFSDSTLGAIDRKGIYLGAAYDASDIEVINKSNGNLYLNIPLASLPADRGGTGTSLSLFYNSKIWKSTTSGYVDTWGYTHVSSDVDLDTDGGWRYGTKYSWRIRSKFEDAPYPYQGDPNPCSIGDDVKYAYYSEMIFPDGSTHVMHPRGQKEVDGFADLFPNGTRNCGSYSPGPFRFYTTDGSYIKIDFFPTPTYSSHTPWNMYFPDGSKVTDDGYGLQRTYDRNGNYKETYDTTYNNHPATRISDQLGREIIIEHDTANSKDYIYQQGFDNQQLKWTIHWQNVYISTQYTDGDSDQDGNPLIRPLNRGYSAVSQIELPSQLGGLSYSFEYDPSQGKGELTAVTSPSGAKTAYKYGLFGDVIDCAGGTDYCTGGYVGNGVATKTLTYNNEYDGVVTPVIEKWLYYYSLGFHNTPSSSRSVAPDGSVSSELYDQPPGYPPTNHTGLEYLPYKTENADGSVTEKIWQLNKIPNRNLVVTRSDYAEQTNAQVKTEFTSLPDSNGNLVKTAIKDFSYDKNGNQTQIVEYDFVDYALIPRDANGRPTGIPSGLAVKRRIQNTYHVATPDASDVSSNNGNIYCNYGSPSNSRLPASVELSDNNGQAVGRSEFAYDNAATTGNLTETKTWSSYKSGIYQPVSNPLTAANSISTSTQYNSYGLPILKTDPKGNQSEIIYGAVSSPNGAVSELYPTQVKNAYGTLIQRTSTFEYDFYLGLVKKATDVDNNLLTETEYDATGRQTKIKSAANTPQEVWTQFEYSDANQRVITRTDLFAKGDGKKIVVQHFDQLGRVRLNREIENSATESPYDETQGVKVQTRYAYNNPQNPSQSNGSYLLTSNPYRTATSGQATNEESMGWTLTYSDKNGLTSTVKTYGGAGLPQPFGNNQSLNGTSSSQREANVVTLTDQAGKKRRSVTDALGFLIRVDEPNGSGQLGSNSSPVQSTNYAYNVLGNLTTVTQGLQTRTFAYDSLSRLKSASNPESGTISYQYDDDGNLTQKKDARQVETNFTFDALNRMTARSYSAPANLSNYTASLPVTYTYDNLPSAKGKLTKITTGAVATPFSVAEYTEFDVVGRVKKSRQTTDGTAYPEMEYTYNLSGAIVEQKYPSGRVVKNVLDNDGELSIVQSKKNGTSGYFNYAKNFTYTAAGAISSLQLGNGKWESTQYNSLLQPTQIALGTTQNATDLLKLNYLYGKMVSGVLQPNSNNGNVAKQTITVPTIGQNTGFVATQYYEYDELNRLSVAAEQFISNTNPTAPPDTTWAQYFTYDIYGNRRFNEQYTNASADFPKNCGTTQSPTMCPADVPVYNPTISTANKNQLDGYIYDAAGNTTKDAQSRKFSYDSENKQTLVETVNQSNTVIATNGEYFYDGDGKRVKKIAYTNGQSETTIFIYDVSGRLVAEYATQPIATPQVSYLTDDPLGSPRINTDQNGMVAARHDYHPFGGEIVRASNGADGVNKKFTGYEKDDETRLNFAQARYQNDGLGRFTSPDPLMASASRINPQTFNRYSYVNNNPLTLSDPSGLCPPFNNDPCVDGEKSEYGVWHGDGWEQGGKPIHIATVNGNDRKCWDCVSNNFANPPGSPIAIPNPPTSTKPLPPPDTQVEPKPTFSGARGGVTAAFLWYFLFGPGAQSQTGDCGDDPGNCDRDDDDYPNIFISRSKYPESAAHITDAQNAGRPSIVTIDRPGGEARRRSSLRGIPTKPGYHRDEYPPAVFVENGGSADVRYINPRDNEGSGSSMRHQMTPYSNGTRVRIVVIP